MARSGSPHFDRRIIPFICRTSCGGFLNNIPIEAMAFRTVRGAARGRRTGVSEMSPRRGEKAGESRERQWTFVQR